MSADVLRGAYDALLAGDPDPLVGLMDDDMVWRGRKRSTWRLWHQPPS